MELAVLGAVCLWAAAVHFWIFREFVWEDAYITYRYAQNLAEGEGFVFNPGDRLLGTTSPLYALVLALAGALGAPIDLASSALYSLFLSFAALQGALLVRAQGSAVLALGFAVLVLSGLGNVLHFFGMETTLLCWLLAVVVTAAQRQRFVLLGITMGLAVLCRYDAAPVTIALAVLAPRRVGPTHSGTPGRRGRRSSPVLYPDGLQSVAKPRSAACPGVHPALAAGAAMALVLAPWLVFAQFYFGSILPSTLAAKAGDASFISYLTESLRLQLEGLHPLRRLGEGWSLAEPFSWAWFVLLLAPVPFVARRVLRGPAAVVLFTYPLAVWLVYAWIGPPVQHRWHLLPASFLLTLSGTLAWGRALRRPAPVWARWGALLAATAFAVLLPAAVLDERERLTGTGFYRGRPPAYRDMARWITRNSLVNLPIATIEPGYLCYLTRSPAIDFAGLVTRGLFFHGPETRRTSMGDVVDRLEPPFLVTSFGHPPGQSAPGYVTAWDAFPSRQLLLRENVFAEHFDRLLVDWRRPRADADAVGHPFFFDVGAADDGGFASRGGFADAPRPLDLDGFGSVALATDASAIPWMGGETPPLRIDFDEIAFRFVSTHAELAVAQLVVEGQVVLQTSDDRRARPAGDGAPPALGPVEVVWPVRPWRGRSGILRFVDVAPEPHFLAADHIRSLRDAAAARVVDDFESGGFGLQWEVAFSGGPYPLRDLARDRGLAFAVGEWGALSLDRPGAQMLRSRAFVLDRGYLSMLAFDLARGGEIDLVVNGSRRRRWRSAGSGRMVPVTWDVRRWRGGSAVLTVRDGDPAPERGIGVDEIVAFERGPDWSAP
jgi:hypothetical protein